MKISYNWLKEYLDFQIEPEELGRILTDTGLEVEGMEKYETVKGGLKGVVIGKVIHCEKHPNADKLTLTKVDIGKAEPLNIVCGAPNVAPGQTVPVATVGTTLYPMGSEEGFTIKATKIRGEASSGMICAEDELGLGTNHEGIMVLDDTAKAGSPASRYFKLEEDTIYEIGLTPNRIDGASHFGVARDIAAYLKHNGSDIKLKKPSVEKFKQDHSELDIKVEVEDTEACPRYSGLTITNLKIGESPDWLKNRLRAIGQTPINNVVDITNFVLHEVGQPLHAFDAEKIKGNKVVVKTLPEGTPFISLDEKERKLGSNDLMICNASEGMCIGGVFGGIGSGVTEKTTAIFLESACFNPVSIRKTSKLHQLNTDASFRFERGTDPNGTIWALKRAAMLMKEVAGGEIASKIIDIYPKSVADFRVPVNFKNMYRLIGKTIPVETIVNILESLDIIPEEQDEKGMILRVPPYRVDVQREADIVEELLRIYGYNNVPFSDEVYSTLTYTEKPDPELVVNTVSDMLSGNGFLELKSNSLTKESYFTADDQTVVSIHNPLSQDLSKMRQSLLPGGLEAIIYNINRKRSDLKLYEFGNCYFHSPSEKNKNPQENYFEEQHLGIFITGDFIQENWITRKDASSFFYIKSVIGQVLAKLGIDPDSFTIKETEDPAYSQGLELCNNKGTVITYGKVSNELLASFDIKQEVYAADIKWDMILELHKKSKVVFSPLPRYPEVRRDLSLLLNREIKFEQLQEMAFQAEKRLLKKVTLFDVYEGDKIEKGKKSYAMSFILLDEHNTLTDKQIDKVMGNIAKAFEKELGAIVRGGGEWT